MSLDINDQVVGASNLVPYNKYIEGSYFGDSDIFMKQIRDSTATWLTEVNALILSKTDLTYVIAKDKEVGDKMSLLAYERSTQHIKRMISALVKENKVSEFAKKLYPDTGVKRNTPAEYARGMIRKYLNSKPGELNKHERKVLRALDDEDLISSAKIPNIPPESPALDEKLKMEKVKEEREKAKYREDLVSLKKNAKDIQESALRIKTNNRIIGSRLHDIQDTARLVNQKYSSMEDTVYRLLVRVTPEDK